MKIFQKTIEIIIVFLASYFLFDYMTSKFISFIYQGSFRFEQILYMLIYFGQSIVIYFSILFIKTRRFSNIQLTLLWVLYTFVMLILLFGRVYLETMINLNILELFNFNMMNIFQILLNFILFIPIGYWFKNFKLNKTMIITIFFVTSIETIQLITHRGIFDIVDILVDSLAILFGYFIFKNRSIRELR